MNDALEAATDSETALRRDLGRQLELEAMALARENTLATEMDTYVGEKRTAWGEGHTALGILPLEAMVLAHENTLAAEMDAYGFARQDEGATSRDAGGSVILHLWTMVLAYENMLAEETHTHGRGR